MKKNKENFLFDVVEKKDGSVVLGVSPEKLKKYVMKDIGINDSVKDIAMGQNIPWKSELTKTPAKINDAKTAIRLIRQEAVTDTLARRLIEIMAQFSATNVRLIGASKYKKFFKNWMTSVKMVNGIRKQMFYHYFLDGNVVILRQTKPIKDNQIKNNKSLFTDKEDFFNIVDNRYEVASNMNPYSKEFTTMLKDIYKKGKKEFGRDFYFTYRYAYDTAAKKLRWSNKVLPIDYTLLNILNVEIKGSPEFKMQQMFYKPTTELIEIIQQSVKRGGNYRFREIIKTLPLYFVSQIMGLSGIFSKKSKLDAMIKGSGVQLFPEDVKMITRMKNSFDTYAYPIMTNALPFIDKKKKMMKSDDALMDNIIKRILLIKVGNDEFPAKAKHIKTMNQLIQQQGDVWKLVWNHAVSIEWIEANVEPLLNNERYEPFNREIRQSVGISSLITGSGGDKMSSSEGLVSLRGMLENISDAQEEVDEWLYNEFKYIGELMQFDSVPKPKSNIFSLEDKVQMMKIYTSLVDRGILARQHVAELLGEDWTEDVLPSLKVEKKYVDAGILPIPGSPYHQSNDGPTGSIKKGEPNGNAIKGSEGRPIESDNNYPADRKKAPAKTANNLASKDIDVTDNDILDKGNKEQQTNQFDMYTKSKKTIELEDDDNLYLFDVTDVSVIKK